MKSGRCLCGSISFTANEVEPEIGACHCRMCQRWAGCMLIAATARGLKFDGEEALGIYRSSDWAERGFCKQCGSVLFYRYLDSDEYELCVGSLDDPSDLNLTGEIFVDRKPDGYALAGDHPRLSEAETLEKYPIFGN